MKAALYTRVSTDIQAEEGFSLDAQLHRLRSYCDSQGWTVYDVYTDEGLSAKDTDRPQLQRMLSDIRQRKVDVVLVYRLDRLTRNVLDLHELLQEFEKYGVGFKSATEVFDTTTAMGRLFITIVAALAQWERENLGERVRMGQAQMVREGRYFGHTAPYGYDLVDGKLYVNPIEANVIRTIFELCLSGNGASRIAKYLNDPANNMLRPHGADEWSQSVILRMLKNPIYCGYVRYGNKTRKKYGDMVLAKSDHEPIISEETFNRVQELFRQRRTNPPRSGTGVHPLVGIIRCGKCGDAMIGWFAKAGTSGRKVDYRGYICNGRRHKRTCNMKIWKGEVIELSVLEELERIGHERFKTSQVEIPEENNIQELHQIEQELRKLKASRQKWLKAFNDDFITGRDLREQLDEIDRQEQILQERLNELSQATDQQSITPEKIKDIIRTWNVATHQEKRELIRSMVDTVWVQEDGSVKIELRMSF